MSTARRLRIPGIAYGGDYNPEQWPEEVWAEDMRLMREAGRDHGQRQHLLLGAARAGARACTTSPAWTGSSTCSTRTASPPTWRPRRRPRRPGSSSRTRTRCRSTRTAAHCRTAAARPSARRSPAYREAALRIAGALAERYADHPAVVMWHIHNEYGCHNARVLLRHERGGVPRLAAGEVRRRPGRRSTTPGARRSGASGTTTGTRSSRPAPTRRGPEPDPPAGLAPLLQRRTAVAVQGGAGGAARGGPVISPPPPTSW